MKKPKPISRTRGQGKTRNPAFNPNNIRRKMHRRRKLGKIQEQTFPKLFGDPIFMHHAIAALMLYRELNPLPEGRALLSAFQPPADIKGEPA